MYFLSAARCNFGFVTVFIAQERCKKSLTLYITSLLFSVNEKERISDFFCLLMFHLLINVLFLYKVSVFSALSYKQKPLL